MQQAPQMDYDYLLKVLLIGNSGVGKTCILMRYSDNQFTNYFYNTIGVDFKIKQFKLEGRQVKLQIWDTAGQDRFRTITSSYYRGAHGIMVVYDVTDKESFENVKNWIQEINKFAQSQVDKILIGNKADMGDQRTVTYQEGQSLADQYGMPFMETSAKADINVEQTFTMLSSNIIKRIGPQQQHRLGMKLRQPNNNNTNNTNNNQQNSDESTPQQCC